MADLLDALRGAPHAPELEAVRSNAAVGAYHGKSTELAADLLALYPEGHEAHGSADLQRIVEAADDGDFDADQGDRRAQHELDEEQARATHPELGTPADADDLDGLGAESTAKTEPAPTGTAPAAP